MAFADLAAIPDLYDEKAMVLVYGRSDIALTRGIKEAIGRTWDGKWIARYDKFLVREYDKAVY